MSKFFEKLFGVFVIATLIVSFPSMTRAAITQPVITATVADTEAMTLLIEGFNLPSGAVYMGKLGGGVEKLNIVSASANSIEAQLKTSIPGTYIVAIALSADQFWTGTVTIGEGGIKGYERVVVQDFVLPPSGSSTGQATCLQGKVIIGGGSYTMFSAPVVVRSYPADDVTWEVMLQNTSGTVLSYDVYAICATTAP
jgi:hypothetical protein